MAKFAVIVFATLFLGSCNSRTSLHEHSDTIDSKVAPNSSENIDSVTNAGVHENYSDPIDQNERVIVSETNGTQTFLQKGSFRINSTADGGKFASGLFELRNITSKEVLAFRMGLEEKACKLGEGPLRVTNLSGVEQLSIDYVKNGTSVGSFVGTQLCNLLESTAL